MGLLAQMRMVGSLDRTALSAPVLRAAHLGLVSCKKTGEASKVWRLS
jgi:hypothetical protein